MCISVYATRPPVPTLCAGIAWDRRRVGAFPTSNILGHMYSAFSAYMFLRASTQCSFTITFTIDSVALASVCITLVRLTVMVASVIPTQSTLCASLCLTLSD